MSADNVMTPEFRVSYPNVFKARKNDLNGKDEYSLVALFPKDADLSKLKTAAQEAVTKKWGADPKKWPQGLKSPFRNQSERAKVDPETGKTVMPDGYVDGGIFINLKSTQRPGLVDANVQEIIDESQFYAGCYAVATVRAYAFDQKGNRGVAFGLQNIQKRRDGDSLTGRTRAEDDFSPVADAAGGSGDGASGIFN